jgi:CTP:molybdopterin cytidylyltransferase MocA
MSTVRPLVVLLAAGSGSRFTGPQHKLASTLGGTRLIDHAVRVASESGLGPVVVVTGATDFDLPPGVVKLHNPNWQSGLASSLQVAVSYARAEGYSTIVVGLGDQPLVTPEAWQAVAAADSPISVATYDGIRGNPVKLDSRTWTELPTTGDEGARPVMRNHPDWVREVPCAGSAFDVDTTQDLETLTTLNQETDD